MKQFEVKLDKPSFVPDWCIWDEKEVMRKVKHTTAIVCAFSEDRLKEKLEKLYPDVRVISYKEIKQ